MQALQIAFPRWNITELNGYEPITTFWQDFSIADKFGNKAIADTFRRAKSEWKDNYKYLDGTLPCPQSQDMAVARERQPKSHSL